MSFFYNAVKTSQTKTASKKKHIPIATMNEMGCKACPLDKAVMVHPKMEATGDSKAVVYVLGEAPDEDEDRKGEHFVGRSGRLLKSAIPRELKTVRYNNIIKCIPHKGVLEISEIECCRNYIVADIEATQPRVIVGAGNAPLTWATGLTNVSNWRGKPVAVKVGKHVCWYYPVMHPEYVLRKQGKYGKSEYERVFDYDWEEILKISALAPPVVYTGDYDKGIEIITGNNGRADLDRLAAALTALSIQPQVGLDIETNSNLRPYPTDAMIITCAVGTFEHTVAFSLDHPDGWSGTLRIEAWGLFIDFLMASKKKIAHSLGFELEWLCYFIDKKLTHTTEWGDTLLMSHTLDERKGVQSLDDLTRQHFGFFLKSQSRVDVKRIMEYPLPEVLRYNGMDAKWTELLERTLHPMIYGNKKHKYEYERKLRLAPALVLTQLKGVEVDFEYANKIKDKFEADMAKVETRIRADESVRKYETQFGRFSPTAPEQVLRLLRDICKRDEVYVDNAQSSDEGVLNRIPAEEVPLAPMILEHRALSKVLDSYVLPVVQKKVVSPDGKIHTKYSSTVAETSRLNSEDPNLQNYPKRKHKEVRGMVVASRTGRRWFLPADYGQLEARVIAWASEDEALMKALWTGYDIHGFWCDRVMREVPTVKDRIIVDYEIDMRNEDVDKKIRKLFRDEIKNGWIFPQFFGSSFKSCADNLKIPVDVAKELSDEFWDEFTGVQKWQERLLKSYERNLYVETLDGFRRRGVLTKNQIINHPIQGTAAHLVEEAMAEVSEYAMAIDNDDFQPVMNIHDDLTFNFPDSDEDTMFANIHEIMMIMCRHRYKFINVPVVVELSMGKNWYESKEIAVYRSNELFNIENPYA